MCRLFETCINVLTKNDYAARVRGLRICYLLLTHSLRCGLEEYRQLRWLASMLVQLPLQQDSICAAINKPEIISILSARLEVMP